MNPTLAESAAVAQPAASGYGCLSSSLAGTNPLKTPSTPANTAAPSYSSLTPMSSMRTAPLRTNKFAQGEPQGSPTLEKEPDLEKILGSKKSFVQVAK